MKGYSGPVCATFAEGMYRTAPSARNQSGPARGDAVPKLVHLSDESTLDTICGVRQQLMTAINTSYCVSRIFHAWISSLTKNECCGMDRGTVELPSKQSVDDSNQSGAITKSTPSKGEGLAAADLHSNPHNR